MGCVSSKLFQKEIERDIQSGDAECPHHVVSLTSSTYGVLNLDKESNQAQDQRSIKEWCVLELKRSPPREEPEIINAWELMEGLEEEAPVLVQAKKSPKSRVVILRGFEDFDAKSPLKLLNQVGSPRQLKRSGGKENKGRVNVIANGPGRVELTPNNRGLMKAQNSTDSPWRVSPRSRALTKGVHSDAKGDSLRVTLGAISSRRRSLGPLFDPELVASFEKELSEEEEQIKKMVSPKSISLEEKNSKAAEAVLEMFEKRCPPGGENAVIIYTTTLRGIRKTFEDCNTARSVIESHHVQMIERDISMHSGFKEDLRSLMGTKDVKVPLVFVKGRLIGGAGEMVKLEEEGKLECLFKGIPKAVAVCEACAGIRFIMCMDCSGSSKVLGEDGKKSVKCGECNENGLIQCPICC